MTLYLIAHKVRGEPAFDIARKACPGAPCQPNCGLWDGEVCRAEVEEWWEIPTSGHRAYPYKWQPVETLLTEGSPVDFESWLTLPDDWPDHYSCNDRDHKPLPEGRSVRDILGNLFAPRPTIKRRL